MGGTVYLPMLDGSVIEAEVVEPIFYDPKEERLSQDSSQGQPRGRTALSGKAKQTIDAPDSGRVGLAITELSHLGKINLAAAGYPARGRRTRLQALPANNRTGSRRAHPGLAGARRISGAVRGR